MQGRATGRDVGALTLFFKMVVSRFFPEPLGSDDLTFRELLVKVANEILLRLEKGSLNQDDLETIGFALRRVYFVAQAYKAEKQSSTLADWMQKLVDVAKGAGVTVAL